MSAKEPLETPTGAQRICHRFERWRKGHKAGLQSPAAFAGGSGPGPQ